MKTFQKFLLSIFLIITICNSLEAQWQYCGNYTGNIIQFIVKDSLLMAGTFGNGVYITSDGQNWTYSNQGMSIGEIISFAVIGNNIFAGSQTEGVYRSTNNGENWVTVNNGLSNYAIHWLSRDGSNLYAATGAGVNLSTNNGDNWSRISPSSIGTVIFSLIAYSNKIIAASANGVFISTDGGSNWNNISSGISSYIYCFSIFDNTVYAGSSASGIFKTTNDGSNWIPAGTGLPSGKAVRTVSFSDNKVFAAVYNSGGIYFLPFSSGSWIQANEGLTQLTCFTVIEYKDYIFAGTVGGIFRRPSNEFISVKKIDYQIPIDYQLSQNYPNPFNPKTSIEFNLPKTSHANLIVYDLLGRTVEILINEVLKAGSYKVDFNGRTLSSGVYFYKLVTEDFTETKKMILTK